jgi:hypothetical protein
MGMAIGFIQIGSGGRHVFAKRISTLKYGGWPWLQTASKFPVLD